MGMSGHATLMYPGNGILKPKCMTGTNSMPKIEVLANMISNKSKQQWSVTVRLIRCRISFYSLLRSTITCLTLNI